MRRLFQRCLGLPGPFEAFILASIIPGFLGSAAGIWSVMLWVVPVILDFLWCFRRPKERHKAKVASRPV